MMQRLLDAPPKELDAETQAICDEVCGALEWFDASDPGAVEYMRVQGFGRKWWLAMRNTGDHECRQKIHACCDAIVRADRSLFFATSGQIFPRQQIRECGGRTTFLPSDPETGEVGAEMIEWPTGRYVSGQWSYEKPEAV